MKPHRIWTAQEIEVLRLLYPDFPAAIVARQLGRPVASIYHKAQVLGIYKSEAFLASDASGRLLRGKQHPSIVAVQWKPGHQPWNKGIKGSSGLHPNSRATQFRPGTRMGAANTNYVPIGSLRVNADGVLERKMTDDPALYPARRWVPVARLVWEAAHGPVPPGYLVAFADPRLRTTVLEHITVDKLVCITRKENLRRNGIWSRDPALSRLYQIKGAITRQVNRIAREAQEDKEAQA